MDKPTTTYINFAYCELGDKWTQINEDNPDLDIYEAMENGAEIRIRLSSEEKNSYYMKKGSKITIKNRILKFNKADFDE